MNYLSVLILIYFGLVGHSALSQCTITIPSTSIVVDVPTSLGGFDKHVWICDSLSHSGFDHFFYVESGGYTSGSGIGITSWVKAGGEYASSGIDDTVYYETGAIFTTAPDVAILCASITFDYSNAPASGCVIAPPPPQAGIVASADTICVGNACIDFMDNSTSTGSTTWNWSFPGGIPASSIDQDPTNICYQLAGSYSAQLIVTDSVGSDTATYTINVLNCTGIEDGRAFKDIQIYPNPVKGRSLFYTSIKTGSIQITDITGRSFIELNIGVGNKEIDTSILPAGLYFVKFIDQENNNEMIIKLIKQ